MPASPHVPLPTRRRPTRRRNAIVLGLATLVAALFGVIPSSSVSAHDDIESSTPADRSVIDEPISSAEIDFGVEIGDSVELFLLYDPGDGTTVDIGGDTVKTSDTTARVDFPELTVQGTYFLRFLAPVPADGHVLVGAISFSWGTPTAIDEGNDDVRASTPSSREVIDEPIDFAEIEFDIEINDDVVLALVFDQGDGENFDELGGITTKTGPRSARVDFDLITEEGTYFVRYTATSTAGGGEVRGATSFTWGEPSSAGSGFPVVPFIAAALVILGIGAWFTRRAALANATDADVDIDAVDETDAAITPH